MEANSNKVVPLRPRHIPEAPVADDHTDTSRVLTALLACPVSVATAGNLHAAAFDPDACPNPDHREAIKVWQAQFATRWFQSRHTILATVLDCLAAQQAARSDAPPPLIQRRWRDYGGICPHCVGTRVVVYTEPGAEPQDGDPLHCDTCAARGTITAAGPQDGARYYEVWEGLR